MGNTNSNSTGLVFPESTSVGRQAGEAELDEDDASTSGSSEEQTASNEEENFGVERPLVQLRRSRNTRQKEVQQPRSPRPEGEGTYYDSGDDQAGSQLFAGASTNQSGAGMATAATKRYHSGRQQHRSKGKGKGKEHSYKSALSGGSSPVPFSGDFGEEEVDSSPRDKIQKREGEEKQPTVAGGASQVSTMSPASRSTASRATAMPRPGYSSSAGTKATDYSSTGGAKPSTITTGRSPSGAGSSRHHLEKQHTGEHTDGFWSSWSRPIYWMGSCPISLGLLFVLCGGIVLLGTFIGVMACMCAPSEEAEEEKTENQSSFVALRRGRRWRHASGIDRPRLRGALTRSARQLAASRAAEVTPFEEASSAASVDGEGESSPADQQSADQHAADQHLADQHSAVGHHSATPK
ncbi:unnamed protein product [Amoebophrya sp. A120]|nr:unnamed protein product [Amoebophrya sp. A120]|eukprot:GSA120T00018600001.1